MGASWNAIIVTIRLSIVRHDTEQRAGVVGGDQDPQCRTLRMRSRGHVDKAHRRRAERTRNAST